MYLAYIDDSRDARSCVFSALLVRDESWQDAFRIVRDFRRGLRKSDGIFMYSEIHAWKFVSGRGHISDAVVPKGRRCAIFLELLRLVARLPQTHLFNAVFPVKEELRAFEWLLNRINRTMQAWNNHAILISDQGKESDMTRLRRKLGAFNPIPSQKGVWDDSGETHKNIPIERIIEDPFYKDSRHSYFIQLVDCCAYALLRRENPVASKTKYGIDKAFAVLSPILVREATKYDPEGIIRPQKKSPVEGL
jgi:hypothetical protein